MPQQMHMHGPNSQLRPSAPYNVMNGGAGSPHFHSPNSGIPPGHPGWNGQRPPISAYSGIRPGSPGVWGPTGMPPNPNGLDISHNIVPDENLTPEQLQRREAGRASLRKIHEMLLADGQATDGHGGMQPMTDFSHINMAQDRGPPGAHMQPGMEEFNMYGPVHGGQPMGPAGPPMSHAGLPIGPNGQPMGPGGPSMGPGGQPMGPGGQPMGPGGQPMGPGGHMLGPGGHPMGHGMMMPTHPHHPHHMSSPIGPGPLPVGHSHMGPGGPMGPHMGGPPHMDMGMYPGGPSVMHSKPPPPYSGPMGAPVPETPAPVSRPSKSKKRKSSTQSPAPQSPMAQPMKSPKYQV